MRLDRFPFQLLFALETDFFVQVLCAQSLFIRLMDKTV